MPPSNTAEAKPGASPFFESGTHIRANFNRSGRYYPGKVKWYNGDGTYAIQYDDGDEETHVEERDIVETGADMKGVPRPASSQPVPSSARQPAPAPGAPGRVSMDRVSMDRIGLNKLPNRDAGDGTKGASMGISPSDIAEERERVRESNRLDENVKENVKLEPGAVKGQSRDKLYQCYNAPGVCFHVGCCPGVALAQTAEKVMRGRAGECECIVCLCSCCSLCPCCVPLGQVMAFCCFSVEMTKLHLAWKTRYSIPEGNHFCTNERCPQGETWVCCGGDILDCVHTWTPGLQCLVLCQIIRHVHNYRNEGKGKFPWVDFSRTLDFPAESWNVYDSNTWPEHMRPELPPEPKKKTTAPPIDDSAQTKTGRTSPPEVPRALQARQASARALS